MMQPSCLIHDMQEKTNALNDIRQTLGLKINKKKSTVMGLNQKNLVSVYLNHEELQTTDNFTYMGSKVYKDGGGDVDIKNRMNKARGAFFRLKPVWRSTIYSRRTKLRLYQGCVLSTLLCGSECWRMTKLDLRHLSTFDTKAKTNRTKQYEQHTRHKKVEVDQPCHEKGGRQHLKDCIKMDT